MFGLLDRDIKFILEVFKKHSKIEKVIIFGSRAMGNFKKASDVDLALLGKEIDKKTLRKVSDDLNEEYPLPYFFDVINYNEILSEDLKEHIDSYGKIIYENKESNGKNL